VIVADLTGELIDGRYQLQKLVATGGMAAIYSALDTRLDRSVAVKIMHSHLANDEDFVNRFIREAKATASLSHPNIVAIQDQGWNEGGTPAVFIVMELIDGFTLREVITERGALTPLEALRYLSPVVSALAAAHKAGIIHRDIKPENILISTDGRVKIADFGLARGADLGSTMTVESSVILGSVSYLSPEQVQRGISDTRSDIYSLGILLFELLTGERPFAADSPIQIAYKHVNERVAAPSTLRSEIPASVDRVVAKATDPNPDKRYRDAAELQLALQALAAELDPTKRQLSLELDIPLKTLNKISRTSKKSRNEKEKLVAPMAKEKSSTTAQLKRKRKLSRRIKRNRIIAILLLLGVLGFSWYKFLGPGSQVGIPSVVGMSQSDAAAALKPLNLTVAVSGREFSEDVPKDAVISSSPGGGGHLAPGSVVHLTVSKGPERITVPILAGLTPDAAATALAQAGLKVGSSSEAFDPSVAAGLISDSNPTVGSAVRRNSLVNLIVSKGAQQVSANSYIGLTSDQALNELNAAGFIVKSSYGYSEKIPAGSVISQTPDGSSPIAKGSTVTLVISKGPSGVYVPNVFSLTAAQAVTTLENMGLKVKIHKIGSAKVKKVTHVLPVVGTKVPVGSTITITVS
jgi:serine/threonine-protein kinase